MTQLTRQAVQPLIVRALSEDAAYRDATSIAVIPKAARIQAAVIAKAPGILAGGSIAAWTFQTRDTSLRCTLKCRDGQLVKPGDVILTVQGRTRSIFAAERTALNFLGHLSGVATLTAAYVRRVRGTRARIYDTRKTLPGLRVVEKNAVQAGGGQGHRVDLEQAILIKTSHLRALGQGARTRGRGGNKIPIQEAVMLAKRVIPKRFVEIEVTNLAELKTALSAKPDAILLDNWRIADIRKAVRLRSPAPRAPRPAPLLEVSGGVTLANVRVIAKTGVDRISIGRLTHSAPSLDVSLIVVSHG